MEGKEIRIKKFSTQDKKRVKAFLDFNHYVTEEELMLAENRRRTPKEEERRLERILKATNRKEEALLFVEDEEKIVGTVKVSLRTGARSHVAEVSSLIIRKDYRRMGLGKRLMTEVIATAKKELKRKPKILRLSVFAVNEPAIKLYTKFGFNAVASIPKQLQYKKKMVDETIMIKII